MSSNQRPNILHVGLATLYGIILAFVLVIGVPLVVTSSPASNPDEVLFRLSASDNKLGFTLRDEDDLGFGKQIFFNTNTAGPIRLTNPQPENRVFLVDWADNQEHFVGPEGIDLTGTEYGILVYNGEKILVNRKLYIERH